MKTKRYKEYGQIAFIEYEDEDGHIGCMLESELKGTLFKCDTRKHLRGVEVEKWKQTENLS